MRWLRRLAAAALLVLAIGGPAHAGGYLWLGAEYQVEGNVYRFNLATRSVDLVRSPAPSTAGVHWNNAATANGKVYLGSPTTQELLALDAYTGDVVTPGAYSPAVAGHKEDGAFHDGSLWRMTHSGGVMHRTTLSGVIETTYTVPSGLVGIEFVNGQPYATNYGTSRVGKLTRIGVTTFDFVPLPWSGTPPSGAFGGLAYDPEADSLYLATDAPALYRIHVVNDSARVLMAADLVPAGYPDNGLPDGLGWIPAQNPTAVPPPGPGADALFELGEPFPNPARDGVWFDLRVAAPTRLDVGVYDVAGRRLRGWVLPAHGPGTSRLMWDLRDVRGRKVPGGTYFVRAVSGELRLSRSFVRVK